MLIVARGSRTIKDIFLEIADVHGAEIGKFGVGLVALLVGIMYISRILNIEVFASFFKFYGRGIAFRLVSGMDRVLRFS